MKPALRVAHASDIHLDTDYFGGDHNIQSRDFCRRIFRNQLNMLVGLKPDLMLLPGDLFDSNRASPETIVWAMEQIGGLPFPVIMIPGNHDCLADDNAIFRRYDFAKIKNVEMLLALGGESRMLNDFGVFVWGKGMDAHTPEFRPLDDLPAPKPEVWNLALGHGIYVGEDVASYRSSPVESRQIEASGYDYIALGHHHALLDVTNATTAFYCGAPIPISRENPGTFVSIEFKDGVKPAVSIHKVPVE
jgi:DNA repair exonuclease SbcCD nuclease subunit